MNKIRLIMFATVCSIGWSLVNCSSQLSELIFVCRVSKVEIHLRLGQKKRFFAVHGGVQIGFCLERFSLSSSGVFSIQKSLRQIQVGQY